MDAQLHLDKENYCIVECLNKLLAPSITRDNDILNEDQIDIFRILHSKLISVFCQTGDSLLETFFNNKFNEKFELMMKNKNRADKDYTEIDKYLNDENGRKLRRLYNKFLRYKNHMNIFEIHKERKTMPKSLFFCEFPSPFFHESKSYVDKHNDLILKCQDEFMKLITDELDSRINDIEIKMEEIKIELRNEENELGFEIEDLFSRAKLKEEDNLRQKFLESKRKAERCTVKKYEPSGSNADKSTVNEVSQITDSSLSTQGNNFSTPIYNNYHKKRSVYNNYNTPNRRFQMNKNLRNTNKNSFAEENQSYCSFENDNSYYNRSIRYKQKKPFEIQKLIIDTNNRFNISKIGDRVFQIGSIEYDEELKQ
ncbi:unnamed protein product, partial [Brachionus calyciflorus]